MPYARRTKVAPDRSKAEIERLLMRFGADQFIYGHGDGRAMIGFRMKGKLVRIEIPIPSADEFEKGPKGKARSGKQIDQAWAQELRRRWRAMALIIKAKLEAIESGVVEFEKEFLAHFVLPDGSTVGEWMAPQVEAAYETKAMPPLLPAAK